MSKLLVVEPDKMLRQAFTVALFPEFQIQVVDALPDAAPKDVDAVIVDASALQERDPDSARKIAASAQWHLPMIRIDGDQPAPASARDRWVRLNRPVAKAALLGALAQCLSATAAGRSKDGSSSGAAQTTLETKRKSRKKPNNAVSDRGHFIELVDVVEEDAAS
ncbi:MAG: hypothetical protein ACREPG_02660 [Candidatus Binatia bacterium]